MSLLLDTHVFLWTITDSKRLKADARERMAAAQAIYVSAASIWEIAIKARLGKIDADAHEVAEAIEASGFRELPIRAKHAAVVATMPLHHTDPFDRLLLAQAFTESLRFLTVDRALAQYGSLVEVL